MRKQRAFAGLSDQEIEQIGTWLDLATYEQVRERVAKPRPEGFDLKTRSTRPFETLYVNKNRLNQINRKIETGQKLTLAEFNAISAGEKPDVPEEIHDAIMDTVY